jgi:uncharacterized coiled-coil DUF342 family protein
VAHLDRETFDRFMIETGKRIADLRAESAKHRTQRNEARAEAKTLREQRDRARADALKFSNYWKRAQDETDALRAELEALRSEAGK